MPFDINYIMNLIDDKFDSYINQLMDIKTKFKILIAQKLELINSIFPENEKKVIETQNRMLSILNNEDSDYFQKINTQLEQLKVNKSDQKNMNFIEKYNSLIKMAFDDENDFNMKYNLYLAQKEIEKNNKSTKESILDKMLEPYFNEAAKNLQNIYQKINKQNNTDLDNLKKKYDDLLKNPGKNEIEDEEKEEEIKNDVKLKAIPEKKIFPKKINEEPKKIIKEEPKKITTEKPKQKIELLQIEFEPPKIEYNRVRKKELEAMKQENDEEFESKFLKIEEDGDDGLLLAKIIDGKDIDQDSVDLEQFFIDNLDDKLDIQYYEGIKFEGENGGEGLNDEAVVVEDDEKEENKKDEEIQIGEQKEEAPPKKEECKNEEKLESAEKKKRPSAQGEINQQPKEKPVSSTNTENVPGKVMGKLNQELMNKMKSKLGGMENKVPLFPTVPKTETKPEIKETPIVPKKKAANPEFNNIAQLIEDKMEKDSKKQKKEENNKENPLYKGKFDILKNLAKSGGKKKSDIQKILKELPWEERGKVELMAVNNKNNSVNVYNLYLNNIEEVKTKYKFPLHASFVNIPPYLYVSGGKANGKDSNLVLRIQRIEGNHFKLDEIVQLKQGRSSHCSIYVPNINSLLFISGSKIKTCEKYSFSKEKMESFPSLKVSRENCGACLINEKNLYVFFGFDRTQNKFETTIEKIFINDAMSWEIINMKTNQNFLKKQNFSCIPFEKKENKGILIIGGVNALRNETKEVVYIDLDNEKAELFNQLPCNSSFTNIYFTNFGKYSSFNETINISNEFNIIKFNLDKNTFLGA